MNIRSLPKSQLQELIERRSDSAALIKAAYVKLLQSTNTKDDPEIAKYLVQAAVLLHPDAAIEEVHDLYKKEEEPTQVEESETNDTTEEQNLEQPLDVSV